MWSLKAEREYRRAEKMRLHGLRDALTGEVREWAS